MATSHEREVTVFEVALQLPPEQREAYLEQMCADDQELLQRVRSLLNADEKQTDFLVPASNTAVSSAPSEKPGDRIGPYKLLQLIGEGGCGVVYMAEQDKPIHRRVALKIIKLGMDTKQVIARFEAERQALALMDHPNIAKVHDAGATATGRPYFVMELVRGVKITDYCDEKKLTTRQRLELFIQVCQAVQHAHQKGIIHRDLKPSNILVTVNDGVAVAKVIDFGIAKATTGERLTDKTLFTAFEQFIGTPAYVSPEQAEITSVDIDTRSDIYSLGVLLYELLTGQTPFDTKQLLQAGLNEMRRTLREVEPPTPSTRLSTLGAEELTTTAERRGMEGPRLVNTLRGDLDWIVMKCLEKDRTRRYESASVLALDIQRHLEDEPVLAHAPSRLYEFQKAVRRHKLGFLTTGAVMAALALGLSISTWSLAKERQTRRRADTEAAKSEQIARFFGEMLRGIDPDVARGRDTSLLREVLNNASARVARDLTLQPLVEAQLEMTIGYVYAAIGDFGKAEVMARSGLALRRKHLGSEHIDVAASLFDLSYDLWQQGRLAEAETSAREALAIATKVLGKKHLYVSSLLQNLARVVQTEGRLSEAEGILREALAINRELHNDLAVAIALNNLFGVLLLEGNLSEGETAIREALETSRGGLGVDDGTLARIVYSRGNLLYEQGRLAEAEGFFREALALRRKNLGNNHSDTGVSISALASTLRREQKFSDAEPLYRECLDFREKAVPNAWYTFYTRTQLGATLLGLRRHGEAEPLLLSGYEGMKIREADIRDRQKVLSEALQNLVQLYQATSCSNKVEEYKTKLAAMQDNQDDKAGRRSGHGDE